ncbi:MAG: hypothetical protein JWL64_1393, partial [Frankiales bacterium]|nr:hypothetical protein [Frankiales bacterium]
MDGDGELRLTVLGEFTATRAAEPIDLGGRRQRAVLAMLVLARGEAVPAGRLIDGIWGERATGNASGALQSYVSHLRRRLEPTAGARDRSGVILRVATGYAVRLPPETVDAWRFETLLQQAADQPEAAVDLLQTALALWRGPAYADYDGEWWVESETARLTGLRAHARERLVEARMRAGESARLVPELEAMVAEEPLREERWRLLALALYRAQRQADALAALRRARGTLADQLGVDPGPGLRALEAQLLAQSPDLDVPAARSPALHTPAPPLEPAPAPPSYDLVDRERELAALRAGVAALARGEAGLVVVEGPAGIGKTRLLTETGRLAEQLGIPVLAARGSQLERSFGFGAARQLFESRVLSDPEGTLLDGAAASARGVFADLQGQPEPDGSFAVLHGLYWLTANLSRGGPVVLTIDDLQWCDSASLRFFAYLVKRLEGLPVLVVATLRTGEAHPDDTLLAELAFDPAALALRPGPLSPEAADLLVRERLGEPAPAFAAACHRTTSGNPLLLRQLLRALESAGVRPDVSHVDMVRAVGSRAVSSLVLMRLRRMAPEA